MDSYSENSRRAAVRTFRFISESCSRQFVTPRKVKSGPFISEVIFHIPKIISKLTYDQMVHVIRTVSRIISHNTQNHNLELQFESLLECINVQWQSAMESLNLSDFTFIEYLLFLLKSNLAIVEVTQIFYINQFSKLFGKLLEIYKLVRQNLEEIFSEHNNIIRRFNSQIKLLIEIKSTILSIFINIFKNKLRVSFEQDKIINKVFQVFVADFIESPLDSRVPETLIC
jgi:hypothetical protein